MLHLFREAFVMIFLHTIKFTQIFHVSCDWFLVIFFSLFWNVYRVSAKKESTQASSTDSPCSFCSVGHHSELGTFSTRTTIIMCGKIFILSKPNKKKCIETWIFTTWFVSFNSIERKASDTSCFRLFSLIFPKKHLCPFYYLGMKWINYFFFLFRSPSFNMVVLFLCHALEETENESINRTASIGEKIRVRKKIEVETCTTECIRIWICVLKEFKKAEKHERNDIRSYFGLVR